ncbi:MAG: insulinase family protein [Cyanobacteria bacterium SIG32]|nr:insulinase family protein [Cyanobacteria bacterium SIG32]
MRNFVLFLFVFLMGNLGFGADFNVFKLENGQTVVIQEIHTNPIVTIDTWVKTGSINETEQNNGVSHFLEHLFFKGTTKHAPGEFDKILEAKGAINNAATSKDFTHYYITIPSKHFDLAMEMHSDMLQNPLIPRKELEKERKVVLEEIAKDLNSPTTKVYNNLMEMMYINHPYKRKVIGKGEIIETITREEILEYFNAFYAPSNMITVIVGDIDTNSALEKIKQTFNSEDTKVSKIKYPKEKELPSLLRKIDYAETNSGYMLIGFRGVKITDKDAYALDVLATILGDGKSSVLYQNIKDKKRLAFNISASNGTFKDDGIFYISANFTPENYEKLEENIFLELAKIQKYGVTQEQVQLAQNIIERDTFYARESITNIAQEIGYTMTTTDNIKFYENYIDNIKKVSTSDIKRVANRYLNTNKSAISVVLPKEQNEVKISNTIKTEKTTQLINQNKETQKYELSNGATFLYTPNEINDIIAISIISKAGEFTERIAGAGKLTASVITKGTKKYSATDLALIMEDNGIKITPSSKTDSFTINVLTTKQQYEKTLELLDEIVNNAILDDYEIEKARAEKINNIKKNRDFPLQKAIEEYNTLIYQGSIYSNSNKILEKTYPQITRNDILEYYNQIFTPQNLVISINGNVDKEKSIEYFSKIFKSKNISVKTTLTIPTVTTPRISTQIDKNTQTAWLFLGWQTSGVKNTKEYATLQVINSLLGSGMSSRLFKNLRDQHGLAYQIGSSFSPNLNGGNLVTYIGTNPQNLEIAKTKLFQEINRLKTEYVGTKELQEAKDKLLGQFVISQETNLEKASTIGWFEASNRGYDFKTTYPKLVNEVTENDIIEVANKYFNDNYVLSIIKN